MAIEKQKHTSNQETTPPELRNPSGKGGFGDNPQNRSTGHWKKEDTPRFKLEKMMSLSHNELAEIIKDVDLPVFERAIAEAMIQRDWKTIREMTHEVYGTPKTSVDVTSAGKQIKTVVEIIDARSKSTDTD